jgi:hypothetical protein
MAAKRELIEPNPGDKRYIRRDEKGRIAESVDVGKSLAQDVRKRAKTTAKPGQGDKGDRPVKKN